MIVSLINFNLKTLSIIKIKLNISFLIILTYFFKAGSEFITLCENIKLISHIKNLNKIILKFTKEYFLISEKINKLEKKRIIESFFSQYFNFFEKIEKFLFNFTMFDLYFINLCFFFDSKFLFNFLLKSINLKIDKNKLHFPLSNKTFKFLILKK